MTQPHKTYALLLIAALCALLAAFFISSTQTYASAPSGLSAAIYNASTTVALVSTTQQVISATTTASCAARIISTASTTLMLTFTDLLSAGVVPTASNGVWQAASTTKEYDSGVYGCGAIRGLSNGLGAVTVIISY